MKKFIASILVAFAFLIGTNVVGASAAPTQVHTVSSASVVNAAPNVIGGVQPAWLYVSCYWAMDGARYCWRYGCSFYERVVLGCYNGWYRTTSWYA